MSDITKGTQTISQLRNFCAFYAFLSSMEPKNHVEALTDADWINVMQAEINEFERNKVWHLEPRPKKKKTIGLKWVFRNKLDEHGIIVRNKTSLVVQGFNQQEGIDYEETFAPVARLEAIRQLISFAAYMGFRLYQMDVKCAFLNGYLDEEYFANLMSGEFEMSMMGELNFFLGLQIKKTEEGIMIHQQKYIKELIKKYKMENAKTNKTPMGIGTRLDEDPTGTCIDQTMYRDMIGSLLYSNLIFPCSTLSFKK
ncbi:uncharacterized protein LOC110716851 [Chenopodium quinoa]|uniref:uncharacterized protein LOC110716851 n=1 Tax=Chenopodium quinoa TaxID=63459 RepID=UPI000B77DED5|nr:uncharacterized protein LOC110716851 [Chenopodium quinoa]